MSKIWNYLRGGVASPATATAATGAVAGGATDALPASATASIALLSAPNASFAATSSTSACGAGGVQWTQDVLAALHHHQHHTSQRHEDAVASPYTIAQNTAVSGNGSNSALVAAYFASPPSVVPEEEDKISSNKKETLQARRAAVLGHRSSGVVNAATGGSTTADCHADRVWNVSWHPTGNLLVSCSGDKTARLWLRRRKLPTAAQQNTAEANSVDNDNAVTTTTTSTTSATATTVNAAASGADDAEYPYSWECVHTIDGEHGRTVRSASWSADGRRLALSSFDGTISVWLVTIRSTSGGQEDNDAEEAEEPVTCELETVLDGHENEVKAVTWYVDPYNHHTVTTTGGAASTVDADLAGPRKPTLLATCSRDRTVWLWEGKTAASGEEDPMDYECAAVLSGHSQDVKSVAWVPSPALIRREPMTVDQSSSSKGTEEPLRGGVWGSGGLLLSCGYDETVRVWREHPQRPDDWDTCQTLCGHDGTVWETAVQRPAIAVAATSTTTTVSQQQQPIPTNPLVATVSDDGRLLLWLRGEQPTEGGEQGGNIHGNFLQVACASGFSNGCTLYSASWCPPRYPILRILNNAAATATATSSATDNDNATNATTGEAAAPAVAMDVLASDLIAVGTGDDSIAILRVTQKPSTTSSDGNDNEQQSINGQQFSVQPACIIANAHMGEVNAVRFCPVVQQQQSHQQGHQGQQFMEIASGGDDSEVKIWTVRW